MLPLTLYAKNQIWWLWCVYLSTYLSSIHSIQTYIDFIIYTYFIYAHPKTAWVSRLKHCSTELDIAAWIIKLPGTCPSPLQTFEAGITNVAQWRCIGGWWHWGGPGGTVISHKNYQWHLYHRKCLGPKWFLVPTGNVLKNVGTVGTTSLKSNDEFMVSKHQQTTSVHHLLKVWCLGDSLQNQSSEEFKGLPWSSVLLCDGKRISKLSCYIQ